MSFLIISSTICCFSDIIANIIIGYLLNWFISVSSADLNLRSQLIDLKKEMNSISMVDEFAKYAKLQRKYTKVESEVKEKMNERITKRAKVRLISTYGIKILTGIATSIMLFKYRNEPVIIFANGTLWPLSTILSWPSNVNNCISFLMWILMLRMTVSRINNNSSNFKEDFLNTL